MPLDGLLRILDPDFGLRALGGAVQGLRHPWTRREMHSVRETVSRTDPQNDASKYPLARATQKNTGGELPP